MLVVCKKCSLRGEFAKEPGDWFRFAIKENGEDTETIILCPECGEEAVKYFQGE